MSDDLLPKIELGTLGTERAASDPSPVRTTTIDRGILGLVVITALIGAIILIIFDHAVPDQVWALATTALGALAGIAYGKQG